MKKTNRIILFVGLALFLTLPLFGHAAVKKASENVYLASGEVHEGNYYAAGNAIEIAGIVNGDVFVAGNTVTISGIVNGDVFAGASNIIISGEIDGSVRVAGSNVSIDAKISRNLMSAGSNLVISEKAEVGRHASLAGAVIDVRGMIGGNLEAAGDTLNIAGEIGGDTNLYFEDGERVTLLPKAHLKGDLDYTARNDLIIKEGAQIDGQTNYHPFVQKPDKEQFLGFIAVGFFFYKLVQIFGMFIVALLVISLFRKKVLEVTDLMIKKPFVQMGRGIVWFFLTPIACIILLITLIGIPLSLIVGVLYAVMLYFAKVFAGIALGLILTRALGWKKASLIVSMIFGVLALVILDCLPIVGWLICLVAIWWGMGALIEVKKKAWKEMK